MKHWEAKYKPKALITGASFAAGPLDRRSIMELNNQVTEVNTTAPRTAVLSAPPAPTKQAAKGSRPKVIAENTGMQI